VPDTTLSAVRLDALYIYARQVRDSDLMTLCIDARNGSDNAIMGVTAFIDANREALAEMFDVFCDDT